MAIKISLPDDFVTFQRWELPNYRTQLQDIEHDRGVYLFRDNAGQALYVGKSKRLCNRLNSHFNGQGTSTEFAHLIDTITVYFITELYELDIYESYAINVFKPYYNRDKVFYKPVDMAVSWRLEQVEGDIDLMVDRLREYRRERRNLDSGVDADEDIIDDLASRKYGNLLWLHREITKLEKKVEKKRQERDKLRKMLDE